MLRLQKAERLDLGEIHRLQVESFQTLLDKYQDFATNPAAEGIERIVQRFEEPHTIYYFIMLDDVAIGMIRVCNHGDFCRVSPICILPEHQVHGYAQQAMLLAERAYPHIRCWTLDTIAQEPKLCHLYEKLGYHRTGKMETIKDGMDIVFYEKQI